MTIRPTPHDIPPPTSPTACTGRAKGYLNPRIFCTQAVFQNSHIIDEKCNSVSRKDSQEVKQKGAILTLHPESTFSFGKYNIALAEILSAGPLEGVSFQLVNDKYERVGREHTFKTGMMILVLANLHDDDERLGDDDLAQDMREYLQLPLPLQTSEEI